MAEMTLAVSAYGYTPGQLTWTFTPILSTNADALDAL